MTGQSPARLPSYPWHRAPRPQHSQYGRVTRFRAFQSLKSLPRLWKQYLNKHYKGAQRAPNFAVYPPKSRAEKKRYRRTLSLVIPSVSIIYFLIQKTSDYMARFMQQHLPLVLIGNEKYEICALLHRVPITVLHVHRMGRLP